MAEREPYYNKAIEPENLKRLHELYPNLGSLEILDLALGLTVASWGTGRPFGDKEHTAAQMAGFPVQTDYRARIKAVVAAARAREAQEKKESGDQTQEDEIGDNE